jgi:two-component system sensor histidine kinase and response regulator WspE
MSDAGSLSLMDLFREEVRSHAATLNQGLLELENDAANPQKIEPLMRAAHSIKGAARIVNLDAAVQLAHAMEDTFVAAQGGRIRINPADIDVLLRGTDLLARLGQVGEEEVGDWSTEHAAEIGDLKECFRRMADGQPASVPAAPPPPTELQTTGQEEKETRKQEEPEARAEAPAGPVVSVSASTAAEVPATVEAVVRVTAQSLNRLMGLAGESLVQARWLDPFATALLKLKKQHDHLATVLDGLKQALAAGEEKGTVPAPANSRLASRPEPAQAGTPTAAGDGLDMSPLLPLRVGNGQSPLASFSALVAEARRQCALCREVLGERIREFQDHAALAEDLNSRLYREVIVSRMRPFGDGTTGFPRLVRDMARRLEKQVRLELLGQETPVDRDILEKLEAPLTHVLRNAVDHGIEPPAQRKAAGKPETGLVRIEASHRAGTLVITVSDDGDGIDRERLRAKIVERGLTTAELAGAMTEAELLEFLFLPGFSTAPAVSEYSGRGVGLDVVQTTLRKIGGSVRVSSQAGQGTRLQLQLPLTLSVLRAVLVDIAGAPYAFPHNRIDRLIRIPHAAVRSLEQRQFVTVDGENIGLVLAAQLLDLPSSPGVNDAFSVVLLSDPTGKYGLIVDAFRGEQDLVVRPLDVRLGKVPNISAAAILDDGSPVLIADVEDLIRSMDRFIQGNTLRRSSRDQQAVRPRKRVLVVEDSITVRELERQLLRNHGYDVAVAVDGKEGWNMVRAETFDLVISDVDMPRMNGLEMVQAMRNDPALRALPVIIVSYKEREEDRLRGLEVGANCYLTKSSFHDNTFLQSVADLIGEA